MDEKEEKIIICIDVNKKTIVHIEDISSEPYSLEQYKINNYKNIKVDRNMKIPFSIQYNKNGWFYIMNIMIATIHIGRQVKKFIEVIFDVPK